MMKFTSFLLSLLAFSFFLSMSSLPQALAQDEFVLIVGHNKTFTNYNYNEDWFQDDPNNPEPWPEDREAISNGNTASVSLIATPGHAGEANALVGGGI